MPLNPQDHRPVTASTASQLARLGAAEAARQQALLRCRTEKRSGEDRRRTDRRAAKPA